MKESSAQLERFVAEMGTAAATAAAPKLAGNRADGEDSRQSALARLPRHWR